MVTLLLGSISLALSVCYGQPQSQDVPLIAPTTRFPAGASPSSVAIADVNSDGKPDIIVANQHSHDVTILLGDGKGAFMESRASPFSAGNNPNDVAVGDFNEDQNLDLAFANHDTDYLTVLMGDGRGDFSPAPDSPFKVQSQPHPHGVAAADFNGDEHLDLVVESFQVDKVEVLFGDGRGGFKTSGPMYAVGDHPYQKVRAADVNGDGNPDVVTTNTNSNDVTILLCDGRGGFTEGSESPIPVARSPFAVAIGDVDGDAHVDLAVAHYSGSLNDRSADGLTILLSNGKGVFEVASGAPLSAGHAPVSVAVGDVNGDGVGDVAVANYGSNDVSIFLGGRDKFIRPLGSPFPVGRRPEGIAVGDLNGDGMADVVTANSMDDDITVLLSG